MTKIFHGILVSGLFFSVLPAFVTLFSQEPSWFRNIVYQTSAYLLFTTLIFGAICFLVNFNEKIRPIRQTIIGISLGFVVIPILYFNSAVFLGKESARFETWHLVSLFTAFYQITAAVAFSLIALGIRLINALSNRIYGDDPPPPQAKG